MEPYNRIINWFVFLGAINTDFNPLVVGKDARWATFDEFIKDAKDNPGKIRMSNAGAGGTMHYMKSDRGNSLRLRL